MKPRVSCIFGQRCRAVVTFHSYMRGFVQSPPSDRAAMHVSLAGSAWLRRRPTQPQLTFAGA